MTTHVFLIQRIAKKPVNGKSPPLGTIKIELDSMAALDLGLDYPPQKSTAYAGSGTHDLAGRLVEYLCFPTHRIQHSRQVTNEEVSREQ